MKDQIYVTKEGHRYPVNLYVHRYYEGNKQKVEYELSRGRLMIKDKSLDKAVDKLLEEL